MKPNRMSSQTDSNYPINIFSFTCDNGAMFGYTLETHTDGTIHFRIPSKPPQTDIVVTKAQIAGNNFEYVGDGVDVKDSTNTLWVNLDGKTFQNCKKVYPGIN